MEPENAEQTNRRLTETDFYALYKDKITMRDALWPSLYAMVDFMAYFENEPEEQLSIVKALASILNMTDKKYLHMKDDVERYFQQYPLEQGPEKKS